MAHRETRKSRVLVVAAGLLFGLLGLWVRVAWLQVGLHARFLARARENQEQHRTILPLRGEILDHRGRVLAHDLAVSQVAVYRPQVAGVDALARRLAPLLGEDAGRLTRRLRAATGFTLIAHDVPPDVGARVRALRLAGVDVEDETERFYPLGAAAAEVLGRTNRDDAGVDGLEYQFERELGGQTGWTTLVPTGSSALTLELPGAEGRPARDGASLVLTLDADLQAIVEHHLAQAVDTLHARRGFALFLDPWTGDVLASACVPHLPPGQAKDWTFTDQYEPGSTFKVVVAGATLEERLARPTDWFEASATGRAELLPGVFIRDAHAHPGYTFFGAIQNSSNIVCGKLGLRLGAERLYRYATALGFGSLTGIEFPGETAGKLRPVSAWQPRSTPTIAIGQEVAVTPVQLALAYGAIANGGVLMAPRLARELRTRDGRVLQRWSPEPQRRVFSAATCATLRTMLTAVVDSGTATAARIAGMRIAGKTGTAQKYDPATGRYGVGMYMASFAGMAPAEDPRLVGVVVIDEPHGGLYYGGQCAAPVFREVVLDLERMSWPGFAPAAGPVAMRPPQVPAVTAPDLRLLPPREAERRLADYGLRVRFEGEGPRVLSQSPAVGAPVERGDCVVAYLAAPQDSLGRLLPDLVGLPVREAIRQLSQRAVRARISGSGLVVRQEPPAGAPLPLAGDCRLWCEPGVAAGAVAAHAAAAGDGGARMRRP